MTPRHVGGRLGVAAFAERADITTATLRAYVSRRQAPAPCWPRGEHGQHQWCEKHADAWIKRPKQRPNPTKNKTEEQQ